MLRQLARRCLLMLVLVPMGAQAQVSSDPLMEYGGIVSRQVTTSMGQLFHSKFVELWNTKEGFDKFNILVKERPYARGGSEILVISDDAVLFRRGLPRDWRTLLGMSAEAVDIAFARASEIEVDRLLFKDPDLAQSGW
jgi:curli production assembly/transport component CsgE